MYFYISSLDRDRAMQKLIELNSDLGTPSSQSNDSNHNERIVPKLDRKKKTINRSSDLIKQADTIISEFCTSQSAKASPATTASSSGATLFSYAPTSASTSSSSSSKPALLEIQYENEVGTGLGPTLEFYALVSLEIQKCENEMWRGEKIKLNTANGQNNDQLFFFSSNGLFPSPINVFAKMSSKQQAHLAKIKHKFKFFGKFVAKAIMDFRVLDLQLSPTFYKWLVDSRSLCFQDIKFVDSQLYRSLENLTDILRQRRAVLLNACKASEPSTAKEVEKQIAQLEKSVMDLDLDFTLPGYSHLELKKNGKDILVSLENLEEYLNVSGRLCFYLI